MCSWDNGYLSGGNYWSNYNGTDINYDGLGDTPHEIDENNKDNYPLVNPHIPGDINHDSIVNIKDAAQIGVAWNTTIEQPNFNPQPDLNLDGIINMADVEIIRKHWQQKTIQLYG